MPFGANAMKKGKKVKYYEYQTDKFVCDHEVTNAEYREFLLDLKSGPDSGKYKIAVYDSSRWIAKNPTSKRDPLFSTYHWHPNFENFPAVNISREGMDLYCEWKTKKFNAQSEIKVRFHLPTEREWKIFAGALPGHNYPWFGDYICAPLEPKLYLANVKLKDYATAGSNYLADGYAYLAPVKSYKPNQFGLYDIIGNAGEITQDMKIKGGSWDDYIEDCAIDKDQNYRIPDTRVGFRVVYDVVDHGKK